jgi:hypothetical protein
MGEPQDDCNALLVAVIPFAEQMLGEFGEFFPFGATMAPDGEITASAAYDGKDTPTSADVIDWLKETFRSEASKGAIIATAIVYEVGLQSAETGASNAIVAECDHAGGFSARVVFPFTLEAGQVSLLPNFHDDGDGDIFPS